MIVTGPGVNELKFTGKRRDTESQLDYFGARYYSNVFGRFTSGDWSAMPVPVPYANFSDPQSLDLYSYVRNNPLWRPDTDGHGFWTKLKNALSDGGWNEDEDAQKERARRLHARAMEARTALSGMKNITIHGETPQLFVQGASDQELVNAQREVDVFLASRVQFPVQCDEGMSCGVAFPVGLRGSPEEGATTEFTDVTRAGAVRNIKTNITAGEFGANLEANGFVKSTATDGTPIYTKGAKEYAVYPSSRSTGGPTAQVKINGQVVGKIRLQ
jgi:RHS repeat-associated protein